jgi:hypothetical protein
MLLVAIAAVVAVAAGGYWLFSRPAARNAPDNAGLYRIVDVEGKFGFVDRSGRMAIDPKFEDAGAFSEDLARVRVGGKYGYIDTKGAVVINPQFDAAGGFVDGLAPVALNDRWGYVDRRGAYAINLQFAHASEFSAGLAAVIAGGKAGYVSPKGQIVINRQFDVATTFSEGLAAVCVGQRWGYIDTSGKLAINPQFDDPGVFADGLAAVSTQGRFGYIGTDGTFLINPQFDSALEFSGGTAAVRAGEKWGYIDKGGKFIVSPQFDEAWPFSDGRGLVRLGDSYGYVDVAGKFVINPQYDEASSFVNGLAAVREKSGQSGFIDRTGKYAWESSAVVVKTMTNMRSIATAWEARATDFRSYQIDGVSDSTVSIDQVASALSPTYIREVPPVDAWGNPFLLRVSEGGQSYSIQSGGPNQTSSGGGAPDADDLVYSMGRFTQAPVSGRPVISGDPFLRELVLRELVGEWRDDRDNCLRIERYPTRVSADFRRCDGDTFMIIGLQLAGRSLSWARDNRSSLAFSWNGILEGSVEAIPTLRESLGSREPLRFKKVGIGDPRYSR